METACDLYTFFRISPSNDIYNEHDRKIIQRAREAVERDRSIARRRSAEKMVYVILRTLNKEYMSRKLRGFEKAMEEYYENKSHSALNVKLSEEAQFT